LPALLSTKSSHTTAFPELTEREDQILVLMARGRDNSDIARELSLSLKTVRNYVSSIFSKLGVSGRAQAIVKAREAGIGVVGEPS
jgi:DNA-binding NarL/FixJ family response regulator